MKLTAARLVAWIPWCSGWWWWATVAGSPAWAQPPAASPQKSAIYTCIDAQGHRITADHPIEACRDREQRELNPNATLRRVVPPTLTAQERLQQAERQRLTQEQHARREEEKRRDRLLLARYPDPNSHERARQEALRALDDMTHLLHQRLNELEQQRTRIEGELEFYRRDPSKAPQWLKQRQDNNSAQRAAQRQAILAQTLERERLNARFDTERAHLQTLWQAATPP